LNDKRFGVWALQLRVDESLLEQFVLFIAMLDEFCRLISDFDDDDDGLLAREEDDEDEIAACGGLIVLFSALSLINSSTTKSLL